MSNKQLSDLHAALATVLAEQIHIKDENGKANAAILNVARQLLKDCGIDGDIREVKELQVLAEELPFDEDDTVVKFRKTG
jgi:hypothetical protein